MASQQEMFPTNSFYLAQVVVFRLPATFSSQAINGRCEQNTISHCMHRRRHFVRTSQCTHSLYHIRGSRLKLNCVPKTFLIPSLVSRHVSRPAQYTQHLVLSFTCLHFSFVHRLRLKFDHVQNTLCRFTRPWRWRFCESRTSHRNRVAHSIIYSLPPASEIIFVSVEFSGGDLGGCESE